MKKIFLFFFICLFTFISFDHLYAAGLILPNINNDQREIYSPFKGMEKSYNGALPWAKNKRFLETITKYKTPIKMAAYKATLKNPIGQEGYNISLATDKLAGYVIEPGEVFSQNSAIGPYTLDKGYKAGPTYAGNKLITTIGGGVCKIASILYNVATLSDLNIIMRFNHSMTVPYVPPGQDATVYYGAKDIRFINDTEGPIVIWSKKVGKTVYMALYGQKRPPKVIWHHKLLKRYKYDTIYQNNPKLPKGQQSVVMEGFDGLVVKSWVTVLDSKGNETIKEKGISYYKKSPCIIEQGTAEN